VKNYFIGFEEVGFDVEPIYKHFMEEGKQTRETLEKWHKESKNNSI